MRGGIAIIVAISLAVLLGFAGLVVDLGTLFVVKTELQSAMDSCALAAAGELDRKTGAIARARSAGKTAADLHTVRFQKQQVGINPISEIWFGTNPSAATTSDSDATYVRCETRTSGITAYFAPLVGASSSNAVAASATATLGSSQTNCPLPIGIVVNNTGTGGPTINTCVEIQNKNSDLYTPGEAGWFNLDGSTNANQLSSQVKYGYCGGIQNDTVLYTPGVKAGTQDEWNARFGFYKGGKTQYDAGYTPDLTGVIYKSTDCDGNPDTNKTDILEDFLNKRSINAEPTINSIDGGYSAAGVDYSKGSNRRIVPAPILQQSSGSFSTTTVTCSCTGKNPNSCQPKKVGCEEDGQEVQVSTTSKTYKILEYACILLLEPNVNCSANCSVDDNPWVLYLGPAEDVPGCSGYTLPGGNSSIKTPVLVQ